jgi:thiamine-monophosphate kinase
MIDVSDGLLQDLGHVAAASGVALDLDLSRVRAAAADGVTDADALTGGEDHALVATLPPGARIPRGCAVIGVVREGSGVHVDGVAWSGSSGWEHYR